MGQGRAAQSRHVFALIALIAVLALAAVLPGARASPPPRQYLVLGTPDHIAEMKRTFGPARPDAARMVAFSPEPLPVLTRSVAFLKKSVNDAFDVAERENVPVAFHLDPLYAWGADLEKSPADAPAVKYWRDPDMREWAEFPGHGRYPANIPRLWFNWGAWNSPAPAVPCLGSPPFLRFVRSQVVAGIAGPMAARVRKLDREGRGYLFAGVNVGWETSIPINVGVDPKRLPAAVWPAEARNVTMQPWEAGAHLGYAALYWHGWDEARLRGGGEEARGRPAGRVRRHVCWHVLHDYNAMLAKCFRDRGIPRDRIETHEVAVGTVKPGILSTITPPIWVAVNAYSTPGFTLDNQGGAVYDLAEIKRQIRASDPSQVSFAASESYLRSYHDERGLRRRPPRAVRRRVPHQVALFGLPSRRNVWPGPCAGARNAGDSPVAEGDDPHEAVRPSSARPRPAVPRGGPGARRLTGASPTRPTAPAPT